MEEEAERVPRRIKEHPYIVVRLKRGAPCPRRDRMRLGLVEIINPEIEMEHLLLLLGPFGPHGGWYPGSDWNERPVPPSAQPSRTQSGSLHFTSQPSSCR